MSTLKYLATLGTGFQRSTISNGGAGYSTGATSIVVADGTVFPAAGDFWVGVGESSGLPHFIKRATARTGNTITVDAAVIAGTDQNEADGVVVQWTLPPEALDQLRQDQCQTGADASKSPEKAGNLYLPNNGVYIRRDTGSGWGNWGPVFPCTEPILGDFSWVNQGSATADTSKGGIIMYAPTNSGDSLRMLVKSAPATPYTITSRVLITAYPQNYFNIGLVFRQSSDGKLQSFGVGYNAGVIVVSNTWNSPTSYTGTYGNFSLYNVFTNLWLRIADDGVNRICSISGDQNSFIPIFSVSRTAFITADQVGIFVDCNNTTYPCYGHFVHYKEA